MLAREMVLLAAAHSRSLHFTPFGFWFLENGAVMQCAVQNVREMVEDVQFLVGFFGRMFQVYIFFNFCSAARFSLWGSFVGCLLCFSLFCVSRWRKLDFHG